MQLVKLKLWTFAAVCLMNALVFGQDRPAAATRNELALYLNAIGQKHLMAREAVLVKVQTRADAEQRKAEVRNKILHLIGGLPDDRSDLAVQRFGTIEGDGFRIEKITYDSQPGLHVTANVYVPTRSKGPFPAVILTPGHSPLGKAGEYGLAVNFARAGIVALAYDPLSEGERLQHFDPELAGSKVGRPTAEHGMAGMQTLLLGEHVSRYFVWDAMRGIDYLIGRRDVDSTRIGAEGCSGGGTVTAYLAALDDRVKVAASACYITSFQELLPAPAGVQEAEQSIPNFIASDLDLADWVELTAPKPYAIVSTSEDFFPFAGARRTFEEAKRTYGLYDAAARIQWITGPGGHGALGPRFPEIVGFFVKWLNSGGDASTAAPLLPPSTDDLLCTKTGQVSTSLGGETMQSINRKRAEALVPARPSIASLADLERLQTHLKSDIIATTAVVAKPGGSPPRVSVVKADDRENYQFETISLHSEDGIDLVGLFAVPMRAGAKPTVLMLVPEISDRIAARGSELDRLANSGHIVLVLQPRWAPEGPASQPALLGPYNLMTLRAMIVGKTMVGMRLDDTIRAIDWLCARPDVDTKSITAYGEGPLAVVVLHAAALDGRIGKVLAENLLVSYRTVVDQPLSRNVPEIVLLGVLRKYDLVDLAAAISPRALVIMNPQDALGAPVSWPAFHSAWARAFETDAALEMKDRVRLIPHSPGAPLPVD